MPILDRNLSKILKDSEVLSKAIIELDKEMDSEIIKNQKKEVMF